MLALRRWEGDGNYVINMIPLTLRDEEERDKAPSHGVGAKWGTKSFLAPQPAMASRCGEYSLGAHANTLRDLLDALGHKRVTIIGQSLGGGVAMQFAYQFPERCERLVLVDSGGLGREVTFYLRMLTVPGFESVFPLFCTPWLRDAGNLVATWLGRAGVRSTPASQEIWRSYASLADAENRRAFFVACAT